MRTRRSDTASTNPASVENTFFAIVEFEGFVLLRNTVGFEIAKQIFNKVSERIGAAIGNAQIYRIGHATIEFTLRCSSRQQARQELTNCLDELERTIEVAGLCLTLKGAIAFADAGGGAIRDELFDEVLATLAVASSERERVTFTKGAARSPSSIDDLAVLRALPGAIAAGELALVYQPKLDTRCNAFQSAEALLRWTSPSLGQVSTEQLISLAERTGAIRELTLWVLKQVALEQADLKCAGHDLTVFVNMSGILISDRPFIAGVMELIAAAEGRIGIEITETAVIGDPVAAIGNLAACSAAGIPLAIDDFGSGLSSLVYLKQLPADELKIDRLFVSGLSQSHRDPLIVRAAIDLAHALEMKVTAEGVDDQMSFSLLQMMGCDLLQGHFVCHPLPLGELIAFLSRQVPGEGLAGQTRNPLAPNPLAGLAPEQLRPGK